MYPNAGVFLSLRPQACIFPHAIFLTLSSHPVIEVPKPMHELHELQYRLSLATIPIRTYIFLSFRPPWILNPSLLHFSCRDEPLISDCHFDLFMFVAVNVPFAITLNSELAWWLIAIHLVLVFVPPSTFIPRHIFVNGVFQ